ncbi:RNA 2'-phosphotransferase [Myxococcota bacterium]|nr:RNA 2'-phosphotransferase [Myxococcota bacterium]MBU1381123.1 RNA 2'-phosphotransferase [Myxococcota bacterium]MBU1496035.1 RNA 2'-phosphotransferase [Myxococcota bacterium]
MKPFNEKLTIKTSKYLSLVLRHKPELIGLILTTDGWASIEELIEKFLKVLED